MPLLKKTGQTKMKLIDKIKSNNKSGKISFVSYITAGDPDINTSLNIMKNLAENGTDIIELGVPFSDPISDGPIIQKATERALSNKVDMKKVLDLVKRFRKNYSTPIVIFGYYNPFLKYGLNKIMKRY
ncbi:MAG: tryptophan synthase subunit alpha [Thermodesulfobacteriota bacterium]